MPDDADKPKMTKSRRAIRAALTASPLLGLAVVIPDIINGDIGLGSVTTAGVAALLSIPLLFLIGIAVQSLPRSWYQ